MAIEDEALQAAKDFLNSLSEEELKEKNTLLKNNASNFLVKVLPLHEIIKTIQFTIENNGDWISATEKLQQMIRGDFDSETLNKWNSFTSRVNTFSLAPYQKEWDTALRAIYHEVEQFQDSIFKILEIQHLAYITVKAQSDKHGNITVGTYEFKPGVSIDKQASSKGGALTAKVSMGGRKTKQYKQENFKSIIDRLKLGNVSDQEIENKYQKLANTYKEVLIRFAASKQSNNKNSAIWWFTDATQDNIGGMVKVGQRGDLAEAFVSFIPQLVQEPGVKPPYSGVLDPYDVSAFLTVGVANVDNAKGRLVGDVMAKLQNGQIQNWAVKASGASQMGYYQMIELADIIMASANPLEAIGETQYADIQAGATRNTIVEETDENYNDLLNGTQKAIAFLKNQSAEDYIEFIRKNFK